MDYLNKPTKDPHAMMSLGGYYDKRKFDLALKYYEMASKLLQLAIAIGD